MIEFILWQLYLLEYYARMRTFAYHLHRNPMTLEIALICLRETCQALRSITDKS
ncbi:hypothetical protein PSYMP_18617, partial [Pseudomonas amygdali pv. morsprunorum str. M302280]